MTSQEENNELKALRVEAKELGVKSWHVLGEEKLILAVAEAKGGSNEPADVPENDVKPEVEKKRSKAPRMNVANIARDDRTAMIQKLEAEDPECKYILQAGSVTDRELAAKGMERTQYSVKNDVVCRTMKDSYEEWSQAKIDAQYESMQAIDGGTGQVEALTEFAKKPKDMKST